MSLNTLARARRAQITEVTIIGSNTVGISPDGALHKLCGSRWVRLELASHVQRHARRLVKYSGHYDVRPANA